MSAFAQEPNHFWNWLLERGLTSQANPEKFFPRKHYGEYLGSIADDLIKRESATGRLRVIHDECVSIVPTASGVELKLAGGISLIAHAAVLAVGHDPEPAPAFAYATRIESEADDALDPQARVLILGTGLSMIDAWLTLEHRGHRGEIVVVSRRGLLPLPHGDKRRPIPLDQADIFLGTELSYFVRWFTRLVQDTERAGGNWRNVVDGLRPFNQMIWLNWSASARRRFMEHVKPWWDIHRHRIAPDLHQRAMEAVRAGRLRLVAAKIVSVERDGEGFHVWLRPRGSDRPEDLAVSRIYDCTGIVKDLSEGSIRVVRDLIARGLARPDPLRLGLDVTTECSVIDRDGIPSGRLFAIGPLTRGAFFEIDAVPDIRNQCARLAELMAGNSSSHRA